MFGISWAELLVIAIVALVVIGPDKIPEVARTTARFVRQMQRLVYDVRESVRLDELRHDLMRETDRVDTPVRSPEDRTKG
ncbi:MAG: twin-arginine translocase subunit TatB [Magnetococcales bacterium]|nr:twin-arginine translocase subunit TatB [Magnetococcales bacterium]